MAVTLTLVFFQPSYAFDSATHACQQNPAYCVAQAGEEAAVPTARGGAELASIAATLRLLTPDTRSLVEQALIDCAQQAHTEVNLARMGGRSPSREECQEVLEVDSCGRKITRAMRLGTEKHALALQCTQDRLNRLIPGSFSLEQRYRYDQKTRQKGLVDAAEIQKLLRDNCKEELVGTLVPDVVIHSGDALQVLAVYDFKFPCPVSNLPSWYEYPRGHIYFNSDQGKMYETALGPKPYLIAPVWKIR